MCPRGDGARAGSERSNGAALSSASRLARPSAASCASNAASTSCRSVLTISPMALRPSAGTAPICFRTAVSSPFLPRIFAFSSRSACSVAAASNRDRKVARRVARERSMESAESAESAMEGSPV